MKKILLITHGFLGEGFKSSLKLICGDTSVIDTLELSELSKIEDLNEQINNWINENMNNIKIICTDISIGTTTKCAMNFCDRAHIISGINLPLLLAIVLEELEDSSIEVRLNELIEDSRNTIVNINNEIQNVLNERKEDEYD